MKKVIFIIFLLNATIINAQNQYIYSPPVDSPSFPGGNGPMTDFILKHMKRSVKKSTCRGKNIFKPECRYSRKFNED